MRKIIEVIGTPDAGKTTALTSLSNLLSSQGIKNELVIETRGKNIFPHNKRGTLSYNIAVGEITCKRIHKVLSNTDAKIILVDKGYVDYLFWIYHYLFSEKCSKEEATNASKLYQDMGLMPDKVIFLTCSPEVAATRCEDSLETRIVKIAQHNAALQTFYDKWNSTPKELIDTSSMSKQEVLLSLYKSVMEI